MKTWQHVRTYWLCFYFLYYKKTWLKNMSGSAFGAEFWSFQTKQRHRIHISLFCYLCGEDRGGGWGVRWGVGGGVRVLFYLQIFSFLILNRHQRERETRAQTKCTSPRWNALAAAGQQRPWGHSEATADRSQSGLTHSSHTFTPRRPPILSKESKTSSRSNHLTHFHPISTAECVHFQANGMSFCRSLWSRINPGIKTDFPGSNLPSSIDFFTLTEPVLPNLTWQPAAQWTGSTSAPHRGSSLLPSSSSSSVFFFLFFPREVKERWRKRSGRRTPRWRKQRKHQDEASVSLFYL